MILAANAAAFAQSGVQASQLHLRAANQAYNDGDYETFTASLEAAMALNPHSVYTRYNLARGYARTGRHAEAMSILQQLVEWRVDFGMADDEDLAALHDDADFLSLNESLQRMLTPVRSSHHRFTIEQPGLIPEGIAIDTVTARLFIGSMRTGDIYVVDLQDRLSKFATVQHKGSLAAVGLEVDAAREILWAIGSAFDMVENFDPEAPGRTGVFGFDLNSGELLHEYIGDASFTGFNDLTVAPSGDLYLSGAEMGIVRNGSTEIEHLQAGVSIYGSNGISVDANGERLFVSSYPVGVAVIELQSGESRWLQSPAITTLYGIDGLYWYEGDLIAVQNGVDPWRLIRIELDESQTVATSVNFIEFANEDFEPTTGAILGDTIYYVGHGPQPDPLPAHIPPALAPFSGKTIVMTAPLH